MTFVGITTQKDNEEIIFMALLHKHIIIGMCLVECILHHEGFKLLLSLSRCFLRAIQTLPQSAYKTLFSVDLKTLKLLHVYYCRWTNIWDWVVPTQGGVGIEARTMLIPCASREQFYKSMEFFLPSMSFSWGSNRCIPYWW